MAHKRKSDPKVLAWYRTERMVEDCGQWFFHTREKTIEGPFTCKAHAENELELYIARQRSLLVENEVELPPRRVGLRKTG